MIKPIVTLAIVSSFLFITACSDTTLDIPTEEINAIFSVIVTEEDADQALLTSSMTIFNYKGQPITILDPEPPESLTAYVAGVPYSFTGLKQGRSIRLYSSIYQTEDKLLQTMIAGRSELYDMIAKPNYGDEIIIDFQRANGEILSSNGFVHNIPIVTAPIAGTVIPSNQQEITVSWDNLDAEQQNSQVNVESYVRCAAYQELGAGGGIEGNWDSLAEKGGFSISAKGSANSVTLQRSDIFKYSTTPSMTPEAGVSRCLAIVWVTSGVSGNINPKFRQGGKGVLSGSGLSINHRAKRVVYYIDL